MKATSVGSSQSSENRPISWITQYLRCKVRSWVSDMHVFLEMQEFEKKCIMLLLDLTTSQIAWVTFQAISSFGARHGAEHSLLPVFQAPLTESDQAAATTTT
jgi:hypothetical protein